jgi:hypothetical protein
MTNETPHDLTPAAADAALARAHASSDRLQARGLGWLSRYMAVFGLGFGAVTAVIGLVEPPVVRTVAFVGGWLVFVLAMVLWSRNRPATLRDHDVRIRPYWRLTFVFYAVALASGLGQQLGNPSFWVPAAVVVALPLVVGAVRVRRP